MFYTTAVLVGCGPGSPGADSGDGSGDVTGNPTTTTEGPSASGTSIASGSDSADTTGTETGPTDPSTTTEDPPASCGAPPLVACDPLAPEACSGEQECTFDYHPKGGSWVCGCDHGDVGAFEACETTTEPGDDCAPMQVCEASGQGGPLLCIPLCESPLCTDEMICDGSCRLPCDPLGAEDCPGALHCGPGTNAFVCSYSSAFPPEQAALGEPCTGSGGCEHGLLCRAGAEVTDCTDEACCAAVCDQAAMTPCLPSETCTALFDDPAPGSETLGVCTPS